jgi:hypothetical protein
MKNPKEHVQTRKKRIKCKKFTIKNKQNLLKMLSKILFKNNSKNKKVQKVMSQWIEE